MSLRSFAAFLLATAAGTGAILTESANADTWLENATRDYYDSSRQLRWINFLGDWRDANGVAQGSAPFASVFVTDTDTPKTVDIDVTRLVTQFGADFRINKSGGRNFIFNSREAASGKPLLIITRSTGTTQLTAVADVSMDSSTVYSQGGSTTLATQYGFLVRFAQGPDSTIQRAVLRLSATASQFDSQTLNVFRPDPALKNVTAPLPSASPSPRPSPSVSPSPSPRPSPTPTPSPTLSVSPVGVDFNAPVVRTWTETATRIYFNQDQQLNWEHNLSDWRDANNVSQGTAPFASAVVNAPYARQVIQIDVTQLVNRFGADFRLKGSGGSAAGFYSREAATSSDRPQLVITRSTGSTTLSPAADVTLDPSTVYSRGSAGDLGAANGFLIRFNQPADASIQRAVLRLTTSTSYPNNQTVGVFRPDPHPAPQNPPALTLGTNADIVLDLKGSALYNSLDSADRLRSSVQANGAIRGSVPLAANEPYGQDGGTGLSTVLTIPGSGRGTEMFMRTILMLEGDFDPNWSGKMPGLANTGQGDRRATQCGWGGRAVDGTCWSARTWFNSVPGSVPFGATYLNFGSYSYRFNNGGGNYGQGPTFPGSNVQTFFNYPIKRGEYFVLDQRVKMNSFDASGNPIADGEETYWINGVPVFQWTGIIWRNNASTNTLPSEAWLDLYVGGTGYSAPHPHHFNIYSVTVSKRLLPFDPAILRTLNGP